MSLRRACLFVGVVALAVYVGALSNGFAWDDWHIIGNNALVHAPSGIWRSFGQPYWPPAFGGLLYRPLVLASYALDWQLGGPLWFHLVNVLWHVGASLALTVLAARWTNPRAGLLSGLVFAVHPVHVEAVAYVVGRADLMAAVFVLLAVYTAVEWGNPWFSAAAWGLGLLAKEIAVVAPALVAVAWWLGAGAPRPPRKRWLVFAGAWGLVAAICLAVRAVALRPYPGLAGQAPVFLGQTFAAVRLTAVSELVDFARLLAFPLTLRADYSPAERTIVTGVTDGRFLAGVAVLLVWAGLTAWAWRRGRRVEAVGLLWTALAYLPVSNLLIPIGVLMGERNLYLASAGLALALGAALSRVPTRPLVAVLVVLLAAGAALTIRRVPVWRDNLHVTKSMLEDSPRSYQAHMAAAGVFLEAGRPGRALEAARAASGIYPFDSRPYLIAAHAALKIGRMPTADSMMDLADQHCHPCRGAYAAEIAVARAMGDTAVADSLWVHLQRFPGSRP